MGKSVDQVSQGTQIVKIQGNYIDALQALGISSKAFADKKPAEQMRHQILIDVAGRQHFVGSHEDFLLILNDVFTHMYSPEEKSYTQGDLTGALPLICFIPYGSFLASEVLAQLSSEQKIDEMFPRPSIAIGYVDNENRMRGFSFSYLPDPHGYFKGPKPWVMCVIQDTLAPPEKRKVTIWCSSPDVLEKMRAQGRSTPKASEAAAESAVVTPETQTTITADRMRDEIQGAVGQATLGDALRELFTPEGAVNTSKFDSIQKAEMEDHKKHGGKLYACLKEFEQAVEALEEPLKHLISFSDLSFPILSNELKAVALQFLQQKIALQQGKINEKTYEGNRQEILHEFRSYLQDYARRFQKIERQNESDLEAVSGCLTGLDKTETQETLAKIIKEIEPLDKRIQRIDAVQQATSLWEGAKRAFTYARDYTKSKVGGFLKGLVLAVATLIMPAVSHTFFENERKPLKQQKERLNADKERCEDILKDFSKKSELETKAKKVKEEKQLMGSQESKQRIEEGISNLLSRISGIADAFVERMMTAEAPAPLSRLGQPAHTPPEPRLPEDAEDRPVRGERENQREATKCCLPATSISI